MVALTCDFDNFGLKEGDIGAVLHRYSKESFEVEFVTVEGSTVTVLTLQESDIRALRGCEILHVSEMSQAMNA